MHPFSMRARAKAFTLIETLLAVMVLAVLLTGFIAVFAPAAAGIRTALNVQEIDRLSSTVERELGTWRTGDAETTGFDKGFRRLEKCNQESNALLVYQYRGSLTSLRDDGTPVPEPNIKDKLPGKDFVVLTMLRSKDDAKFKDDLKALEGGVYLVKCTQLVYDTGTSPGLKLGSIGSIADPKTGTKAASPDVYNEAVIAFAADFFTLTGKTEGYFTSGFDKSFASAMSGARKPVFTRNLALRR